ncbi:hypothetical protein GDO78_018496, partial [Eleutherodactylus coqui]
TPSSSGHHRQWLPAPIGTSSPAHCLQLAVLAKNVQSCYDVIMPPVPRSCSRCENPTSLCSPPASTGQ